MTKRDYVKRLYTVYFDGGRKNKNYFHFLENVNRLHGKTPDYGGIQNSCVISHVVDARTLKLLCEENFDDNDVLVEVEEITTQTLNDASSSHRLYIELIRDYFFKYDTYPNVEIPADD